MSDGKTEHSVIKRQRWWRNWNGTQRCNHRNFRFVSRIRWEIWYFIHRLSCFTPLCVVTRDFLLGKMRLLYFAVVFRVLRRKCPLPWTFGLPWRQTWIVAMMLPTKCSRSFWLQRSRTEQRAIIMEIIYKEFIFT